MSKLTKKAGVKNMPEVSVIIPVYNTEKYLRQCLDSVINQTLGDIEFVCVNDGSSDSSRDILMEYASIDDRVTIINQNNRGAGVARNTGLTEASGNDVHFLDSDDWVATNLYEVLYKNIREQQADVCVFFSRHLMI